MVHIEKFLKKTNPIMTPMFQEKIWYRRITGLLSPVVLSTALGFSNCTSLQTASYSPSQPLALQTAPSYQKLSEISEGLATLWPHFVGQQTPSSCSVASVSTVINTIRSQRHRKILSQEAILQADSSHTWQNHTLFPNSQGVTLDELALHVLQVAYASGFKDLAVDVVHMPEAKASALAHARGKEQLLYMLRRLEKQPRSYFIIANFLQSSFIASGTAEGHMSPVGTFDSVNERVLVLDVDRQHVEPYWVPLETFYEGLSTVDAVSQRPRGYLVLRLPS